MIKAVRAGWHTRSAMKEFKKMKFKAIFRYLYDRQYRAQIDNLAEYTCDKDLRAIEDVQVRVGDVMFSHEINYPSWVDALVAQIHFKGLASLEPIKIMRHKSFDGKYLVIDGNHRLAAMKKSAHVTRWINVILLEENKTPCDYCDNTGQHLCPDVAEPILVPCAKKGCEWAK